MTMPGMMPKLRTWQAGDQTLDFENRYLHKNGSIRYMSWTATPLLEENVMYCIGRDITERKLAEQALNESEAKYRNLVEQANDGIAVVQAERIVFANRCFAEITGRTRGNSEYTFHGVLYPLMMCRKLPVYTSGAWMKKPNRSQKRPSSTKMVHRWMWNSTQG